jgi:hypothetical protein
MSEIGSSAWLSMRRRELAQEWAKIPARDVQAGIREVQDVAQELGIDWMSMTKQQMIRAIQVVGLTSLH